MKFNLDKKYVKICKYIIVTAIIIYLAFSLIDSVPFFYNEITNILGMIVNLAKPFIIGMIIAYLFYGPMNMIERFLMRRKHFTKNRSVCRGIGIAVSYVGIFGAIIALLFGIYFMIGGQISKSSSLTAIFDSVAGYLESNEISTETLTKIINRYNIPFGDIFLSKIGVIAEFVQKFVTILLSSVTNLIITIGSNVFQFVISVIISIYLLMSHEYFTELWNKIFFVVFKRSKAGKEIKESLHIINETFSKYIRGQLIEAVIVAILSSIVLLIVGVDDAIIIGIIAGITNLIPYLGPWIGGALAVIVSLFSGNWFTIIGSAVGLILVQQLDANILSPKIVGDIVGLNPVFVILAITVGGGIYGLLGMLIAVPVAASAKALIAGWFERRMEADYNAYKNSEVVQEIMQEEEEKVPDEQ